jgi:EAL domain-containing protein (putative c-di-GMP-specific phosphodiesterase class I)
MSDPKPDAVPALAAVLDEVCERFHQQGALGLLAIDAAPLAEIEQRYGHEAHRTALGVLGELVQAACRDALGGPELIACGETARSELLVLTVRPADDAEFYRAQLPDLALAIRQRLERQGYRAVYPWMRQPPLLPLGWAYVMRNPLVSPVRQIRGALDEARADAQVASALARREQRREFMELLVSGSVQSVFEPVVDSTALTVFGYEALVRGPEGSAYESPAVLFRRGIEENLIFELDCLCRRKAIEGARDFPQGAKLFLNIRPTSIHDPSFQPDTLRRTLGRCGLSPADVVFEISEQESIENYQVFREARDAYGRLGFQFALDDTGAGYASLEAVMELSPEFIKVDRAFVAGIDQDPARQNMVRAFQAIASHSGARIVGEGLDRIEELQTLARLGIPFGQGWLFGKASPLRGSRRP